MQGTEASEVVMYSRLESLLSESGETVNVRVSLRCTAACVRSERYCGASPR
jgi:hypothetical protein